MALCWVQQKEEQPTIERLLLQQIAQEVRRVLSKDPEKIKLEDFEIKFVKKSDKPKQNHFEVWKRLLGFSSKASQ